jgi:hypothetical protein
MFFFTSGLDTNIPVVSFTWYSLWFKQLGLFAHIQNDTTKHLLNPTSPVTKFLWNLYLYFLKRLKQCFGSRSVLDPHAMAAWILIRIRKAGPEHWFKIFSELILFRF